MNLFGKHIGPTKRKHARFLLKPPPGTVRRNDHETSIQAALDLEPNQPKLKARVLRFALDAGPGGFIDQDLFKALASPDDAESSLRKRRTELTERNWIMESGFSRPNSRGRDSKVWVHRNFVADAPMILNEEQVKKAKAKKRWSAEDERAAVVRYLKEKIPISALADHIADGDHLK
jgi:hypothetical protein